MSIYSCVHVPLQSYPVPPYFLMVVLQTHSKTIRFNKNWKLASEVLVKIHHCVETRSESSDPC